jgi:hypothetical protein
MVRLHGLCTAAEHNLQQAAVQIISCNIIWLFQIIHIILYKQILISLVPGRADSNETQLSSVKNLNLQKLISDCA